MKITNKHINEKVQQLQEQGMNIAVGFEGQPARPRLSTKDGDRFISDRMAATDLAIWIDGYVEGFREGHKSGRESQEAVSEVAPDTESR